MSLNSLDQVDPKHIATQHEKFQFDIQRGDGCWIWPWTKNWDGYGHTKLGGRNISAHKLSYLIFKGDIPLGMVVRHCCPAGENRACVNPAHLELGSKGDNNRDTVQRGKGGRGGPTRASKRPLRINSASLASDGIIFELWRKRANPTVIATRIELPREHVVNVIEAVCDSIGNRDASQFERRFWSKVNKTADCWLWTAMTIAGYGRIVVNGKVVGAHRVSWRLHRGRIPKGLVVCHNCPEGDNPRCVNPGHLFLASQRDNMRDSARKKRLRRPGAHAGEFF